MMVWRKVLGGALALSCALSSGCVNDTNDHGKELLARCDSAIVGAKYLLASKDAYLSRIPMGGQIPERGIVFPGLSTQSVVAEGKKNLFELCPDLAALASDDENLSRFVIQISTPDISIRHRIGYMTASINCGPLCDENVGLDLTQLPDGKWKVVEEETLSIS